MAKAVKTTSTNEAKPAFHPATCITEKSMVVDMNGVAWWVDPSHQTITKASAPR